MKKRILKTLFLGMFTFWTVALSAQVKVSGTVKSDEGELLPGVSIIVKGTSNGTISDIDGNYTISAPDESSTLVFSFVGMAQQEVLVGNQSTINVTLKSTTIGIDDVVVTALGMKKDRKALGYNISQVNSEDMETGGVSNALKSLEGKVTGVQINSLSSSPTSSVMFNIRGVTSLNGIMSGSRNVNNDTQPLIVVDGVVVSTNQVSAVSNIDVGNYMSSINPNDIESISVLKGASAAALYGSQAGNGVILITTKTGANAKKGIGVSINSATSIDMAYSAPPVQRKFFQSGEEGEPATDDKKGLGWAIDDNVNNVPVPRWNLLTQQWETSKLEARGDADPLLAFLRTGVMLDNNVSVTGNYDKGNYKLSVGNLTHYSVVPSNETKRNSVSFNSLYKVNDKISVTSQASFSRTFVPNQSHVQDKRQDNPLAHAMSMPINMPKMSVWRQADNWLTGWEGSYQNTPYLKNPDEDRLSRVDGNGWDKAIGKNGPYFAAEEIIRTYAKNIYFGKVQLDWQLADPLTFTLRSGLNSETFAFERKTPWGSEREEGGGYEQQHSNNLGVKTDALLSYSNYFLDNKLSVDGLLGVSYDFNQANSSGFSGSNLSTPNAFNYSSLPANRLNSTYFGVGYASRTYGTYATASIGWQSMVYLELSGRQDWVGVLDYEKDSHFYPGVSLSWLVSETFKEQLDWVSLLKLRGGYAETGYGIGNPINLDSYGIGSTWNGVAQGTIGGGLVDSDIKPELNITKEVGIDFGFLDNRIYGEFTAYSKEHVNQIQNLPVVASSGFSSMLANMGSVKSSGIEASLTVVPVRNNDWDWRVTANVTTNKSVITELDDRFESKFFSYDASTEMALFVNSKVGDLYASDPISRIETGKYKGMMLTGPSGIIEESITTDEYVKKNGYLGNINPDAILGFTTDLKYKNFSLGIVTSLRVGGIFVSETQKIMIDDGMADLKEVYGSQYDEYWTGGRFAGGLPSLPNPDAMFTEAGYEPYRELEQYVLPLYNGDPRYFGYWNAVYIDPNYDLSGLSPEDKVKLPDEAYIRNGDDPTKTIYLIPYGMEGNELWSGAQFRTWDATNFKIKEINFTYSLPKSVVQSINCQAISFTLFAKNVMYWSKNGMNEDPETAFHNGTQGLGIAYFGLPPIRTMGLRVALNF